MANVPGLSLQAIEENEREALYEMAVRFWQELMPHAPVVQDPSIRPAYFAHEFRMGQPGHRAWWAIVDGQRAGFCHLALNEDWAGRTWAYLKGFYVEPRYRRQGIGRAFAQAIVDHLREQGVHRVDLHARSDAPAALAFWRALGYDLASYRLRQYLDGTT
jgi:ribosomal protein S18 acetylase RimI-like enzyme